MIHKADDDKTVEFKLPTKVENVKTPTVTSPVYDTKYLDEMDRLQTEDVKTVIRNQPSEVLDVEIRLRDGYRHKGDKFVLDGIEIYIPQLSFLDIRRATREGIKIFGKTDVGKKILYSKRQIKDEDELLSMTSFEERQVMREMTDIEDLWLAWFALRDIKHPKISGDFSRDRCWIEYLPRVDLENFINKLRQFNGMEKLETPSGEDDIKSFPDDGLGNGIPRGDDKN
jgi:hypothetical protein